jgi:hypothetical protein
VTAEWVEGELSRDFSCACRMLVRIHKSKDGLSSSFCYVEDFLIPRFVNFASLITTSDLISDTVNIIKDYHSRDYRISHPDLIPDNIIVLESGESLIIDNELLCFSRHYIIDLFNLLRNIRGMLDRIEIFNMYMSDVDEKIRFFQKNWKYFQALWVVREVGSFLSKGNVRLAEKFLKNYIQGKNILPVDISK